MAEEKQMEETPIAFKDFRKSVSVQEFEAILLVVRKEYDQLESIANNKEKFDAKAKQGISQLEAQKNTLPPGLADKLIEGIRRKAERGIKSLYSAEIIRQKEVTDFLNRFQTSDKELPYLDFSFINFKKEDNNGVV